MLNQNKIQNQAIDLKMLILSDNKITNVESRIFKN